MAKQLYYEDITEGGEITPLTKQPTKKQLVMWAGAVGDYFPIHYDKDFAQSRGLPGVIVHGQLIGAFLGQLITDWIGAEGLLKKLSCSYKGMTYPDEALTFGGKVTKKYVEDGTCYVECSLWGVNSNSEKTASGAATVILPSRG